MAEDEDDADVAWPEDDEPDEEFGAAVAQALDRTGYCFVSTSLSENDQEEAMAVAEKSHDFTDFRAELEVDYFGKDNATKAVQLKHDTPDKVPSDALQRCDRQLTQVGLALAPFTESVFGFTAFGRSNGMARLPFSSKQEASRLESTPIEEDDIQAGAIEKHITFMQSRKICMLYLINNEGGDLWLYPRDGPEVKFPLSSNRIVIFRHDHMSYKYKPRGNSLSLQSWMLSPIQSYDIDTISARGKEMDEVRHVNGPTRQDGMKAQILAFNTRFPAEVNGQGAQYWSMTSMASDGVLEWPYVRMDQDLYFTTDGQRAGLEGKSYTNHGGFLTLNQLHSFDNKFFGITDDEATVMNCNARINTEMGYEVLHLAGWTRETLNGKHIGIYIAEVGPDWQSMTPTLSLVNYRPELYEYHATGLFIATATARLHYLFNLVGPTMNFDTACSASLVATHMGHIDILNMYESGVHTEGNMFAGTNTLDIGGFIGNCAASMLSHIGRCFTFDRTADGYQRGEGTGWGFMKVTNSFSALEDRWATIAGTCANQDGRSASLTAPNGPSQQMVVRKSLKFAGIEPGDVTLVECHGTGTALGDPIEVGAVLAVMDGERDTPLPHTSAKSNFGHLEACAGMAGLIKCLNQLLFSCCTPNVHLKALNAHLESQGFPQTFEVEMVDTCLNSGYSGVSSFGFGGTNSRGDLYGFSRKGPRARNTVVDATKLDFVSVPCPKCMGPMCWRCGVAVPCRTTKGAHRCSLIREDGDYQYCSDCYDGAFRFGEPVQDLDAWNENLLVSIAGTWDAFSRVHEMEQSDEGVYVAYLSLGDARWEQFHLVLNRNRKDRLYPITNKGGTVDRIRGPDADGEGHNWIIDGRADNLPAGTIYKITFQWGETSKKISWEKTSDGPPSTEALLGVDYKHRYFISGSFIYGGQLLEMIPVKGDPSTFERTFEVGRAGREEFQFLRDRDRGQAIYPLAEQTEDTSVPIRGPDEYGNGKNWLVRGKPKELVTVRLRFVDGRATMSVTIADQERVWETDVSKIGDQYYCVGDFNDWDFSPMTRDEENPGIWRFQLAIGDELQEEFQIVLNADWKQTLHPDAESAQQGESMLMEPDDQGYGKNWMIMGEYGMTYEIVLDLNEPDRRNMVTWSPTGDFGVLMDADDAN